MLQQHGPVACRALVARRELRHGQNGANKKGQFHVGLTRLVHEADSYSFDDERQDLRPNWNGP